jgi:uncharacterized protein (DUF1697 family)
LELTTVCKHILSEIGRSRYSSIVIRWADEERNPMTTHIGLLRAVNVAGRNKVGMAELRDLLTDLGMKDVRSMLQSGNLVFRSDIGRLAGLESMLEETTQRRLGLKTDFLVRTGNDWRELVTDNPLREEAQRDPSHFMVMFLSWSCF